MGLWRVAGDAGSTTAPKKRVPTGPFLIVAEWTGLEPATTGVTGRYSNQLNYHSNNLVGADGIEPPTLAL